MMQCITPWCKSKDFRHISAPEGYSLNTYAGEPMIECCDCGSKWLDRANDPHWKRATFREVYDAVKEYRNIREDGGFLTRRGGSE